MTTTSYHIGDCRRITGQWTVGGTDTDPTTITFQMREPDGFLTTYVFPTNAELVKVSDGNYRVDWPIAKEGRHAWTWIGTGVATEAEQGEFYALERAA